MPEIVKLLLWIMLPFSIHLIPGGRFYLGRKKVREIKKEKPLTTKEYLERL